MKLFSFLIREIRDINETSLVLVVGGASTVSFLVSYFLSRNFNYISAVLLIVTGLFLYACFVLSKGSFFEIRAIFSAVWLVSIGLACLRLNVNQKPWMFMTWVCFWLTYFTFIMGYFVCFRFVNDKLANLKLRPHKKHLFIHVENHEKILLRGILVLFLITLGSFLVEAARLRYIPIFSKSMSAYSDFHLSGFHYFTVSSVLVFPFAYYYIRTYHPGFTKKIILIVLSVVASLVPLLIVSRQLFMFEVIIAMLIVVSVGKKNEIISLVLSGVIMIGGYGLLSFARNQNTQYLERAFNVIASQPVASQPVASQPVASQPVASQPVASQPVAPQLDKSLYIPMFIYQPYMYVTFNFDNFNYFLSNHEGYTFGKNIFAPIILLTPLKNHFPSLINFNLYRLNPNMTTYPISYSIYYDFGLFGMILYMFIIGFVSCWVVSKENRSISGDIFVAIIKYALIFSFFANSFANPSIWFYFVLLLITGFFMKFRINLHKSYDSNTFSTLKNK